MTARYTLVQLSDPHLVAEGTEMQGVDTFANLSAAVDAVVAAGIEVSAFVLSGDLTDEGQQGAYRRARNLVEPVAGKLGAEVVYVMGNHDERAAFRAELLDEPPSDDPVDRVHRIGGLRVIVLDSSRPGRGDGRLSPAQLDWLRVELATPAPDGTVLVVHHPPLRSPVPIIQLLPLHEPELLADAVRGSDVRLILSGHGHHASGSTLAGIPVWAGPSLAYCMDIMPPRGRLRGLPVAAYSLIELGPEGVVSTAIPLPPADVDPVFDIDAESTLRNLRESHPEPPTS